MGDKILRMQRKVEGCRKKDKCCREQMMMERKVEGCRENMKKVAHRKDEDGR